MTKKEKIVRMREIESRLTEMYPNAECALEYDGDPWKLLVMGRLSAQCTDARVNIVSKELFRRFPTAEDMSKATIEEIEEIIKPCGLYRMKAANIKESSALLIEKFGGILPQSMEELLLFPGVGRKIANLLLGDVFGADAIVTDTHCIRICARLGMYDEGLKEPYKIEMILRDIVEKGKGSDLCHRIVLFGRDICTARSPRCIECPLKDICEHALSKK